MKTLLDLKNTAAGKCLAVFLSFLLVFGVCDVSAYAGGTTDDAYQTASDAAQGDDTQASGSSGDNSATTGGNAAGKASADKPSNIENAGDNAATTDADAANKAGNAKNADKSGKANEADANDANKATAQDASATVKFTAEHATVKVADETLASGKNSVQVPAGEDLEFSATANDGYVITEVTAKDASSNKVAVKTVEGSVAAPENAAEQDAVKSAKYRMGGGLCSE